MTPFPGLTQGIRAAKRVRGGPALSSGETLVNPGKSRLFKRMFGGCRHRFLTPPPLTKEGTCFPQSPLIAVLFSLQLQYAAPGGSPGCRFLARPFASAGFAEPQVLWRCMGSEWTSVFAPPSSSLSIPTLHIGHHFLLLSPFLVPLPSPLCNM
mmetsp:Transcript_30099/g.79524  ORF Transcript_30099/g.79524 Transcript_30099/m.79524 type:complete len:153 (-) Transcript_30099:207-665(-)